MTQATLAAVSSMAQVKGLAAARRQLSYRAGEALEVALAFRNPFAQARSFYIVGGLERADTGLQVGEPFGVVVPEGETVAVNLPPGPQGALGVALFEVGPGLERTIPCRFVFPQSDATLALALLALVGESPDGDELVGGWEVDLAAPMVDRLAPVLGAATGLLALGLVVGLVRPLVRSPSGAAKEGK